MTSEWEILALGLVLGVRHALDADHLVAITTIVSEYRNPLRAIWVGVSWGLGHTTTLFLSGAVLLVLDLQIPDRLALVFEFGVGIMLVALGVQTLLSFRRHKVHIHSHIHSDGEPHQHFHSHQMAVDHAHPHPAGWRSLVKSLVAGMTSVEHHAPGTSSLKPFFRVRSYLVGAVHGLAGSAVLMLLVLAGIRSTWSGISYMLLFGLGTIVSMGLVSVIVSLPFSVSGRMPRLNGAIRLAAGVLSCVLGLALVYETGIAEGLLAGF